MLPVHLHAGDDDARRHHGQPNGKTEAWHILDCAADATVLVGIQPGLDRPAIQSALREERWDDVLIRHPVRPGDTVYVPGGVLHSFGPDILIFEIQQTSDLTRNAMPADLFGRPYSAAERAGNLDGLMGELRV